MTAGTYSSTIRDGLRKPHQKAFFTNVCGRVKCCCKKSIGRGDEKNDNSFPRSIERIERKKNPTYQITAAPKTIHPSVVSKPLHSDQNGKRKESGCVLSDDKFPIPSLRSSTFQQTGDKVRSCKIETVAQSFLWTMPWPAKAQKKRPVQNITPKMLPRHEDSSQPQKPTPKQPYTTTTTYNFFPCTQDRDRWTQNPQFLELFIPHGYPLPSCALSQP